MLRDYLALLTPGELELLPADCRPQLEQLSQSYVEQMAVQLMQCDLKLDPDPARARTLHEMAALFVAASKRMAQLEPEPDSPLRSPSR